MEENQYFQKALSNFTAEYAYAGAVRHLYDLGYSPEKIKEQVGYPVSIEKIEKVIADYEKVKNSPEGEYEYVQETDEWGRRSFRKVKHEKKA